jgi:hypothetical protein
VSSLIVALPALKKLQETAQPNTLRWHVEKALAEGKNEAIVYGDIIDYVGADNTPEEIISFSTVVIARPVASVTKPISDHGIKTLFKFKVVETLSEGLPCTRRCIERTPPEELSPVGDDEFVLGRQVGTLTIDGVKLTIPHNPKRFPLFSEDKTYLLFLGYKSNGVTSLLVGPEAVFTIGDDGETLVPVGEGQHRFKDFIKQRFDSSAGKLKQHLKDRES